MFNLLNYFKTAPQFEVWHSHPRRQSEVLITAGMHGDEISSIEAAKSLTASYTGNVPITTISILNVLGYKQGVSYNPLDGRDLIYLYPGSRFGSSSSKLMAQLSKHASGKKLWIDLHGGAKGEQLKPFIWAPDPYPELSHVRGRTLIEPTYRKDIPYILLEAGELGQVRQEAIDQHLDWIYTILKNLGQPAKVNWQPTFNQIIYDTHVGQDLHGENFLWSSPTYYISGKID